MSEREKGAFVYKGAGRRSKMTEDAAPEQRLCDTFHVQRPTGGTLAQFPCPAPFLREADCEKKKSECQTTL